MVDAEGGEDRGVEVADVLPVLDGAEADLVGGADHTATVDSPAGEPDGEAVGVVVPATVPLLHRGPTELAPPEHERLVEEAAAGKILEQRRGRSVGLPGVALVKVVALVVAVPAVLVDGVVELHDAHTAFDHAAREQTHPTVGCGGPMRVVDRIEGEGLRCIAGEVTDIRGLGLHPVGKLVGRDPPVELGLPGASVTMAPVERLREIECRALHRGEAGLAGDACVYQ